MRDVMNEFQKPQLPRCFGCNNCGYRSGTFKAVCPKCGSAGMAVQEGTDRGKVVDFVPVSYPPENLKHLGQYISVLVRLDNGCQIFGIVLEVPNQVKIGTSVLVSSFNDQTKELFFKTI